MGEPLATRALGTKLKIGTNFIAGLKSIGGLELSADTIDATTLDSDGGYREFIGGFKDAGEVSASGFFGPNDPGQAALYAAFESGAVIPFQILFPARLGATWSFNGVVTGFSTTAELEDAVNFEATIKVSGKPSLSLTPSGGLSALMLTGTGGALTPAFANGNYSYAFNGVTAASVTVTATAANHSLMLFVDGTYAQDLTSGSASAAIPLTTGVGKKLSVLATETGKGSKMYEIVAIKTA